jgi:dihydropteroate synthase
MLDLEYLHQLAGQNAALLSKKVAEFDLGGRFFAFNSQPALMGVINLSPDSWYRESVVLSADKAIERGRILSAQGAHIVDIGAESTLAQAARVADERQKTLLGPIVKPLARQGILVSVETYSAAVARDALEQGAKVINLTGSIQAEDIFRAVAEHDAGVILCYVQGPHVREVGDFDLTSDPILFMEEYFKRQLDLALQAGVKRVFIDPGLGFYYRNLQDSSVRVQHQMTVLLNSFRLRSLGWPICHALPHAFEYFGEEVRSAEPFFALLAALGQTSLFRTHEIPRTKAVLDTMGTAKRK